MKPKKRKGSKRPGKVDNVGTLSTVPVAIEMRSSGNRSTFPSGGQRVWSLPEPGHTFTSAGHDTIIQVKTQKPETILEEAQRLIYGDRNQDYGHPLDDFSRTAQMATGLLRDKLKPGVEIVAEEFGMLMILAKLSRQINRPKRDNMVDTAGYAGTVQMCIEERNRRKR